MSNTSTEVASLATKLRAAGSVFAEDEARMLLAAAGTQAELDVMIDKRVTGVPIEHIVGWAEFCGQRVALEPGVFVPRPRTEFLVQQAVALAGSGAVVVDLCTGSGAVALAISAAVDVGAVHAADVDPTAVRCARRNLGTERVHEGDLFEALPASLRGRVHVAVANTPYVPSREISRLPREARLREPRHALDGGADGLDVQRRIAGQARAWLAPGGHLLVEASERQSPTSARIFARGGLTPSVVRSAEYDTTVVIGTAGGM